MLSKNKMTIAHCLKKLEVSGIFTRNNLCRVYSGNGVAEHKLYCESEQVRKKSEEEEVSTGNSFNMFYCEREKKGNWWKMMVKSCFFFNMEEMWAVCKLREKGSARSVAKQWRQGWWAGRKYGVSWEPQSFSICSSILIEISWRNERTEGLTPAVFGGLENNAKLFSLKGPSEDTQSWFYVTGYHYQ